MDGSNPAGQVMNLDVDKAGIFHHLFKLVTIRKFQDRIRQILIGAALRNKASYNFV